VTNSLRAGCIPAHVEPHDRVGVMVVRVWLESGLVPPVRARLTAIDDIVAGGERVVELATADPAAIAAELESWLAQWIATGRDP
jgi:hypothetical protein